jgi:hypothetical protein
VFALLVLLRFPSTARANGLNLQARVGSPGERIAVFGSGWLVGQPPVTPAAHVRLFLETSGRRVELFDVDANFRGEIKARFTVPDLPDGTYALQSCGHAPGGSGRAAQCLDEGPFKVIGGAQSKQSGSGRSLGVIALIGVVVLLGVGGLLFAVRRR